MLIFSSWLFCLLRLKEILLLKSFVFLHLLLAFQSSLLVFSLKVLEFPFLDLFSLPVHPSDCDLQCSTMNMFFRHTHISHERWEDGREDGWEDGNLLTVVMKRVVFRSIIFLFHCVSLLFCLYLQLKALHLLLILSVTSYFSLMSFRQDWRPHNISESVLSLLHFLPFSIKFLLSCNVAFSAIPSLMSFELNDFR